MASRERRCRMRRTGIRGQVLLVFLAGLLALQGIAALGIDVGYLYTVRHELQRCTDAGALAGASAFLSGKWSDVATRTVADGRARAFAAKDKVATSILSAGSEVAVAFPAQDRVRVDATRNVNLFFARLFLGPTRTVTAYSIAEASVVDINVKGLKPWGIPYPWEDTNGNDLFDPGETVHRDCPEGVLDGAGGSGYRDAIVNGCNTPVTIGDAISLEPGNMVGPTRQGTSDLVNADPNSQWNEAIDLPESNLYQSGDGSWMNSPRVIRIPIYDPEIALHSGRTEMVVAGFAGFWIESIEPHQATVIGRFIPMRAFGQPGPAPGPAAGPVLKTLRLVE